VGRLKKCTRQPYQLILWFWPLYATCFLPHTTHLMPPAASHLPSTNHFLPSTACFTLPSSWWLQSSMSRDHACRSKNGVVRRSEIGSIFPLESILGSIERSMQGVYHRVQLGMYLRACLQVYWRVSQSCTWECLASLLGSILQQVGSVSSSAIGNVPQACMPECSWGCHETCLRSA